MRIRLAVVALVLAAYGCSGLVVDPSPMAAASGDVTMALRCGDGPLSAGFGVCRPKEGTQIQSNWNIVLPKVEGAILGGEVIVRARDVVKSYGIPKSGVLDIPLADLFGVGVWQKSDTTIINATARVRFQQDRDTESEFLAEGQLLVRVLAQGYDPMPIDSGFAAWGTTCKVVYSTAGRGAVQCK